MELPAKEPASQAFGTFKELFLFILSLILTLLSNKRKISGLSPNDMLIRLWTIYKGNSEQQGDTRLTSRTPQATPSRNRP